MNKLPLVLLTLLLAPRAAYSAEPALKVTPSGEIRVRFENRNDNDFKPKNYDRVHYGALRARVGLNAEVARKIDVFLQPQFTDYFGGVPVQANDPTFRSTLSGGATPGAGLFDLHQGYLQFKDIGKSGVNLKLGRQEINLGDQRLVGSFDYSMTARHFDGANVEYSRGAAITANLFAARVYAGPFTRGTGGPQKSSNNDPDKGKDLAGVYLRTKAIPLTTLDVYEILYRDGWRQKFGAEDPSAPRDKLMIFTTGSRVQVTPVKGLDLTGEVAVQRGHRYDVAHKAMAWAAKGLYKAPVFLTPLAGFESIFASGDRNGKDGTSEEFDNLFPTNHFKYGALDFFGWRNIRAQHATLGLEPRKNLGFYIDGWVFHLPEANGPWKNAGGGVVLKPQGNPGSHYAGKELDFTARYVLHEKVVFFGHYGRFVPGTLIDRQGGPDAPAQFVMAQVQTSF